MIFLVFGDISLTIFIALKQFSVIILSVESNPRLFGFCFTSLCDWFSRHYLSQSGAKLKPWSPGTFSLAVGGWSFFSLSSHWLSRVYSFALIRQCDYIGFGFTTLNQKLLYFLTYCICFSSHKPQGKVILSQERIVF